MFIFAIVILFVDFFYLLVFKSTLERMVVPKFPNNKIKIHRRNFLSKYLFRFIGFISLSVLPGPGSNFFKISKI